MMAIYLGPLVEFFPLIRINSCMLLWLEMLLKKCKAFILVL